MLLEETASLTSNRSGGWLSSTVLWCMYTQKFEYASRRSYNGDCYSSHISNIVSWVNAYSKVLVLRKTDKSSLTSPCLWQITAWCYGVSRNVWSQNGSNILNIFTETLVKFKACWLIHTKVLILFSPLHISPLNTVSTKFSTIGEQIHYGKWHDKYERKR